MKIRRLRLYIIMNSIIEKMDTRRELEYKDRSGKLEAN